MERWEKVETMIRGGSWPTFMGHEHGAGALDKGHHGGWETWNKGGLRGTLGPLTPEGCVRGGEGGIARLEYSTNIPRFLAPWRPNIPDAWRLEPGTA